MTTLKETTNVKKLRNILCEGVEYTEISAIGDGNCGLNAFVMGLINLIQLGELNLHEDTYAALLEALNNSLPTLKERLNLYKGLPSKIEGNAYTDLAAPLSVFIHFIKSKPSLREFEVYLNEAKTREQVAAISVGMAPALRLLGENTFRQRLVTVGAPREHLADLDHLTGDGVEMGHELSAQLAYDFFKLNLTVLNDVKKDASTYAQVKLSEPLVNAPTLVMIHRPGHWNAGILANQKQGLAELPHSEESKKEDTLSLSATSKNLRELAENLLKSPTSLPNLESVASHSERVVNQMKEEIEINAESLRRLGLKPEQIKLILNPLSPTQSTDAALAFALQNAEIAGFLSAHYHSFAKKPVSSSINTEKVSHETSLRHRK